MDFEQAAAELEKSIKDDQNGAPLQLTKEEQDQLKDAEFVKKAFAAGIEAMRKAKGDQPTDLSQEKAPKSKTVTETEDDPAEHPKPSGKGYKDTRPYVGKMGKGEDDDDDDGKGKKKPAFFKGKMKKSEEQKEKDDDEGIEDVTEFMSEMAKCMNYLVDENAELSKAVAQLTEGSAVFGEVLHGIAELDPRRDGLLISMSKALQSAVEDIKVLKKGFGEQADMLKAVSQMPGVPRAVGISLVKSEADAAAAAGASQGRLSEGDRSRLFKAASEKLITPGEYRDALQKGDASVLTKISGAK